MTEAQKQRKKESDHRYWLANRKRLSAENRKRYALNRERDRKKAREYYYINRKQIIERACAWAIANPSKARKNKQKHYLENKDEILKRSKEIQAKQPEKRREIRNRWKLANPDKDRASKRKWKKNNPDKERAAYHQRRARKLKAGGSCSAAQMAARIAFYGGMCAYCKSAPYEHLDHVIPLARGGTNWPANLRPSCAKCNLTKNSKFLYEWLR